MIYTKQITGKTKDGKLQAEFTHCFFDCSPFKQKEINLINKMISITRLNDYLSFKGYGEISFDDEDTQKRYPLITFEDNNGNGLEWNRKNTNCLIFKFNKKCKNDMYDELYLYHTVSHTNAGVWFGWIVRDSKTKRMSHRFFIPHDIQELLQALNRFIYHIPVLKVNEQLLKRSRTKTL